MTVIYQYYRYYQLGEEEMDTEDEAMQRAVCDIEYNEAYPFAILSSERVVLHDAHAIQKRYPQGRIIPPLS